MPERDYALAVLSAAREVPGRTMLQKAVYLASALRNDPSSFRPHFYGPYSGELQAEVVRLVAAGLMTASARRLEPWEASNFDPMQYTYQITARGEAAAASTEPDVQAVAQRVVQVARSIGAWNAASLSMAAKLHHLREAKPGAANADVPALARQFGWRMSESDARLGHRLLDSLSEYAQGLPAT